MLDGNNMGSSKGRIRKPDHLKAISGTARPDRVEKNVLLFPASVDVPDCPTWLKASAAKEWHRIARILAESGVLTEASYGSLAQMCCLYGRLVDIWTAGGEPDNSLISQYRSYANDFGLTPAAQSKVKAPKKEDKPNAFSTNGKKRA